MTDLPEQSPQPPEQPQQPPSQGWGPPVAGPPGAVNPAPVPGPSGSPYQPPPVGGFQPQPPVGGYQLQADSYSVGTVIGWAVVTMILMVPLMFVGQFAALALGNWISTINNGTVPPVTLLAGLAVGLIPIVLAVVMMRRAPSKAAGSPWIGVLIGSALFLLVFGGSCVALIGGLSG